MTGLLVDTTVLVDYLREVSNACDYLERLESKPSISAVTLMELYAGSRSRREDDRIARLLVAFHALDIDEEIASRAGQFLKHYRASHSMDDADALIAATAEHHNLKLATLNVKHFPMFPKLKRAY